MQIILSICCYFLFKLSHSKQLKYRNSSATSLKFRILQIADLHVGEAESLAWGPEDDKKSMHVIQKMIQYEKPDLVVLSGDQLSANNIDANASSYYKNIINTMLDVDENISWAMIFGNHDDMAFEPYNATVNVSSIAKTSRRELLDLDESYSGSYTQHSPSDDMFGVSNYFLPIYYGNKEASRIYLFDSGGGSLPQSIDQSQIEWFNNVSRNVNTTLPSIAFQHIPPQKSFLNWNDQSCSGMIDDQVTPVQSDAGIINALSNQGIHFLSVGHDHGNDFCCPVDNQKDKTPLYLCFGRHSGYGGYGQWDRGARVYDLFLDFSQMPFRFSWRSWVRMESGDVIHEIDSLEQEASSLSIFSWSLFLSMILATCVVLVLVVRKGVRDRKNYSHTRYSIAMFTPELSTEMDEEVDEDFRSPERNEILIV